MARTYKAYKAGDLVAFSGASFLSDVINVATWGVPRIGASHVAILADPGLVLWESTTLDANPCLIQGKPVSGVQAHAIDETIERYSGRVWLYPVIRPLYVQESLRLTLFLRSQIGKSYDEIGAFRSAGFGPIEKHLRPENLHSLFCSELVAAAYREIGLMNTDNASRWNPNRLLRHLRHHEIIRKPVRLN